MTLTPTIAVVDQLVAENDRAKTIRDKRSPASAAAHYRINRLLDMLERNPLGWPSR